MRLEQSVLPAFVPPPPADRLVKRIAAKQVGGWQLLARVQRLPGAGLSGAGGGESHPCTWSVCGKRLAGGCTTPCHDCLVCSHRFGTSLLPLPQLVTIMSQLRQEADRLNSCRDEEKAAERSSSPKTLAAHVRKL